MTLIEIFARIWAALTIAACGVWMASREEWIAFSILVLTTSMLGIEIQLWKIANKGKP